MHTAPRRETEWAGLEGRPGEPSEEAVKHIGCASGLSRSTKYCAFVTREENRELERAVPGQVPVGVKVWASRA